MNLTWSYEILIQKYFKIFICCEAVFEEENINTNKVTGVIQRLLGCLSLSRRKYVNLHSTERSKNLLAWSDETK